MVRKSDLIKKIKELQDELDATNAKWTGFEPHVVWLIETAEVCLRAAKTLTEIIRDEPTTEQSPGEAARAATDAARRGA